MISSSKFYDFAASTPQSSEVARATSDASMKLFSNPSSSHNEAVKAASFIEDVRVLIADKIGAMPSEIVFTSGATESNNLAIKGLALSRLKQGGHIITSSIEHKCVLAICAYLEALGFEVSYVAPDANGLIQPAKVKNLLRDDTFLISIHHINNELGIIQPIAEYGAIAFEHGAKFHTDAAQSFCKVDIDVDDMDIDMLSLSGHKIYGPKGVGALYIRDAREADLVPVIHGAGQEMGLRGGTLPTPLIVGLGAAVEHFPQSSEAFEQAEALLNEYLGRYVITQNSVSCSVPFIKSVTFATDTDANQFLSDSGFHVSQGSACNAYSNTPSHVLTAIGLDEDKSRLTYRISLPPYYLG